MLICCVYACSQVNGLKEDVVGRGDPSKTILVVADQHVGRSMVEVLQLQASPETKGFQIR